MTQLEAFWVLDARGRKIGYIRRTLAGRWAVLSFTGEDDDGPLGHVLERDAAVWLVSRAWSVRAGVDPDPCSVTADVIVRDVDGRAPF